MIPVKCPKCGHEFQATGNIRERIVTLLKKESWSVSQLAEEFDTSTARVCYHLRRIREEYPVVVVGGGLNERGNAVRLLTIRGSS